MKLLPINIFSLSFLIGCVSTGLYDAPSVIPKSDDGVVRQVLNYYSCPDGQDVQESCYYKKTTQNTYKKTGEFEYQMRNSEDQYTYIINGDMDALVIDNQDIFE